MARRTLPDAEYLHQCFSYDPDTGTLIWRHRPLEHFKTERDCRRWNNRYASTPAGHANPYDYVYIGIHKRTLAAHRIIWKMMTGNEPPNDIDHRNRNPSDNRWTNLRLASNDQNVKNKGNYINNTSGFKGVSSKIRVTHTHPYQARIRVNGILVNLGYFTTAKEAHEMYLSAAKVFFGDFYSDK